MCCHRFPNMLNRLNNQIKLNSITIRKSLNLHLSRVMRKPNFYICENKGADQLCSNCTADQRLCFRYTDSTIPPLLIPIFKILAFFCGCTGLFVSDLVGNSGFLATRLISFVNRLIIPINNFSVISRQSHNFLGIEHHYAEG